MPRLPPGSDNVDAGVEMRPRFSSGPNTEYDLRRRYRDHASALDRVSDHADAAPLVETSIDAEVETSINAEVYADRDWFEDTTDVVRVRVGRARGVACAHMFFDS